jgi:SAM-dependent methyltransferase
MQKVIFLNDEGDAWFERNHQAMQDREFSREEPVINASIKALPLIGHSKPRLLEVGCGEGKRLAWMSEHLGMECHGIEPSGKAVASAKAIGVLAQQGTADALPYDSGTFDILVFGFCLYLCDREDLFRIAQEADRVLRPDGWIVIQDFFSLAPARREYHHKPGIFSHKMDHRRLFDWHPAYTCFSHELTQHGGPGFTDDPQEWVATSVLRKARFA